MVACFLNHGVDVQIEWPRKETVIAFGPYEIVAFPPSKDHDASLHIDLRRFGLTAVGGMSVLNQLLSIAAWLDDTFAVLLPGWSGNPVPCRPDRQTCRWSTSMLDGWCNNWAPIEDAKARRALAIYREAVNMEHFYSLPYAVLGCYKILEEIESGWQARSRRLEEQIARLLEKGKIDVVYLREIGFDLESAPADIEKFCRREGRNAVAHATNDPRVNPDEVADQRRMSAVATILRSVARSFIQTELCIGTNPWDQRDHR